MTIIKNVNIKKELILQDKTTVNQANKQHIVVVEDEEVIARVLQIQLEPHFRLKFFITAEEALAYIRESYQSIDLIILDYMLAGMMDGLQLLSIIRQNPSLKHLRVILQSATSKSILDAEISEAVKPDSYVSKPWNRQQMINAIDSVLSRPISF